MIVPLTERAEMAKSPKSPADAQELAANRPQIDRFRERMGGIGGKEALAQVKRVLRRLVPPRLPPARLPNADPASTPPRTPRGKKRRGNKPTRKSGG